MTRNPWSVKSWVAFVVLTGTTIVLALLLDAAGVVLPGWGRPLYAFCGVGFAALTATWMSRGRR